MTLIVRNGQKIISFIRNGTFSIKYPCKDTQFCPPLVANAYPGEYLLEVWGAEGSKVYEKLGGKGGYSSGKLNLHETTKLFINIGGQGQFYDKQYGVRGGNNGGGKSYYEERKEATRSIILWYGTGGGSTDIRITSNELDKRVIVAGGGGSAGRMQVIGNSYYQGAGGCGGGETGGNGKKGYEDDVGLGGSPDIENPTDARGTGGGFYKGTIGKSGNGSGGGSGFIFKEITDDISLDEKFFLTEAKTINGETDIPGFDGKTVKGNSGNGSVRITILKPYTYDIYLCTYKDRKILLHLPLFMIILCFK